MSGRRVYNFVIRGVWPPDWHFNGFSLLVTKQADCGGDKVPDDSGGDYDHDASKGVHSL